MAHVLRAEASQNSVADNAAQVEEPTPIYPNLDDTAQWVFPEDVEYLEGVVKENDMHVQSMDQA